MSRKSNTGILKEYSNTMPNTYNKIELNKDKISGQLLNISDLAKKNKWKFDYNEEVDELTFGLETMPRNSFLFNVNNEINLFLTPTSRVNGIFIEYFANNYIKHHKELQPVLKMIEDKIEKQKAKKERKATFISRLENELVIEALRTLHTSEKLVAAI